MRTSRSIRLKQPVRLPVRSIRPSAMSLVRMTDTLPFWSLGTLSSSNTCAVRNSPLVVPTQSLILWVSAASASGGSPMFLRWSSSASLSCLSVQCGQVRRRCSSKFLLDCSAISLIVDSFALSAGLPIFGLPPFLKMLYYLLHDD